MEFLARTLFILTSVVHVYYGAENVLGVEWLAWEVDTSVSDGFLEENLITTLTASSNNICLLKCFQFQQCVTIGYSELGTCDLYNDYLTGRQTSLTFQHSTVFYKTVRCRNDYIPVRHLGFCFKVHTTELTFDDARETCQSEGGDLIVLSSSEKYDYVEKFLLDLGDDAQYWFGVQQAPGDISDWKWIDNTPLSSDKWNNGEPNMIEEECAFTRDANGHLMLLDIHCTANLKFVCGIV